MKPLTSTLALIMGLLLMMILPVSCNDTSNGNATTAVHHTQPMNKWGQLCISQCRKAEKQCEFACALNENACLREMSSDAMRRYEDYALEQRQAGKEAIRSPKDFEDANRCPVSSCRNDCRGEENSCFGNCTPTQE